MNSSQRLKTDQLLSSYRQSYQVHTLLQEISELKSTLELKDKQVFYLSSQIVSLKDEHLQKMMKLQNNLNENKKELTQLRYLGLKGKRIQSQKGDRVLEKQRYNHQRQIREQKQSFQAIIQRMSSQHKKEIESLEEKVNCVVSLSKKQQQSLKDLLNERKTNNAALVNNFQKEIQNLQQEKEEARREIHQYEEAIEQMKNDFRKYGERVQEKQKQSRIQIQKLKSQNLSSKERILQLEAETKRQNQEVEKSLDRHIQEVNMYKEEIEKMKFLIVKKDKQLSALVLQNSEKNYKNNIPMNPIRECNHLGLIQQLQTNIDLKQQEIKQLSQKLELWSQYIGLDKEFADKRIDLSSAAETAINSHKTFVKTLKKKSKK